MKKREVTKLKVLIDIPDYTFDGDIADKFQDYFNRVKVETEDGIVCGVYELEITEMFLNAFKEMQVISDTVTNGDIIKTMFPEYEETRMCGDVRYGSKEYANLEFVVDEDWWDTPYKPIKNLDNADKSGLEFADMPTLQSAT